MPNHAIIRNENRIVYVKPISVPYNNFYQNILFQL